MSGKPRIIASDVVYRNPHYAVRHDRLLYGNGYHGDYYVLEKPEFVIVIAFRGDEMALVEQYRHPVGERLVELPMGRLNPGETPLDAARREIREETGHEPRTVRLLRSLQMSSGTSRSTGHVVLAGGLEPLACPPPLDPTEDGLVSRFVSAAEWRRMLRDGEMVDGNSLAGWAAYAGTRAER